MTRVERCQSLAELLGDFRMAVEEPVKVNHILMGDVVARLQHKSPVMSLGSTARRFATRLPNGCYQVTSRPGSVACKKRVGVRLVFLRANSATFRKFRGTGLTLEIPARDRSSNLPSAKFRPACLSVSWGSSQLAKLRDFHSTLHKPQALVPSTRVGTNLILPDREPLRSAKLSGLMQSGNILLTPTRSYTQVC
jgi:hypothetical protein